MKEIKICKGLTLQKKEDGHWLLFKCNSGNEVVVCLENIFVTIQRNTMLEWAKETLEEAEPTSKYITKDIDWTGCDPEIKAFLLANPGKAIKCKCKACSECDAEEDYITAYDHTENLCYRGLNDNYLTATPIIRKQRFLPLSDLIKVLEDKKFKGKGKSMVDELGNHYPISSLIKIEKTIYNDSKNYNFPILPEFLTSEES